MDGKEKTATQDALRSHGALPILTSLKVSYSNMNASAKNMGLFEECIEDTGRICDAFGVPYKLLSSAQAGTLNNSGGDIKEARKQMFEETIIPDAQEKINSLNNTIIGDVKSWYITGDYKHLPVFDEDRKQRAMSLKLMVEALDKAYQSGAITLAEYSNELLKYGIG
jgi:hypothetical protein